MFRKLGKADTRFLLLLLAIHAVFFFIAVHYTRIYNGDSHEYIYMAVNIKDSGWFYAGNPVLPVQPEYMTLRPPVYSLFLCTVYLFCVNNWIVLLIQNLISIFNIYLLRHSMRIIGYSRAYDWLLMAFVLMFPSQFVNANTIAPDILLQTCVIFYFYFFLRTVRHKKWRYVLGMSIALVAGAMVKPVLYPVVYIHAAVILLVAILRHKALLRALFCAIIPLAVVTCYGYVNYARTGKLHFSSTQSFNAVFYYYNYYRDVYGVDKAEHFLHEERSRIAAIPVFADRYDYANKRGMILLKENFVSYTTYHISHSMRMLVDPGKGELDMFMGLLTLGKLYDVHHRTGFYDTYRKNGLSGVEDYMTRNPTLPIVFVIIFFNIVRLLGFLLFLFNPKSTLSVRVFIAVLVGYFVLIAGAIAATRYFIPGSLIVMGCAVLSYQRILQRVNNKPIIVKPER